MIREPIDNIQARHDSAFRHRSDCRGAAELASRRPACIGDKQGAL